MAKHLIIYTAASKSSKKSSTTQSKLDFKYHKCSEEKSEEITYCILHMICADLRLDAIIFLNKNVDLF